MKSTSDVPCVCFCVTARLVVSAILKIERPLIGVILMLSRNLRKLALLEYVTPSRVYLRARTAPINSAVMIRLLASRQIITSPPCELEARRARCVASANRKGVSPTYGDEMGGTYIETTTMGFHSLLRH